jgi:hypothetical protein
MNDCFICYETRSLNNMVALPCAHTLCKTCLNHLQKNICPFCRYEFSNFKEYVENNDIEQIEQTTNNIRRKRNKKKHKKKNNKPKCVYIIRKGKNAGEMCGKHRHEDRQYCSRHRKSETNDKTSQEYRNRRSVNYFSRY